MVDLVWEHVNPVPLSELERVIHAFPWGERVERVNPWGPKGISLGYIYVLRGGVEAATL